jgi:TATA-binding protein-associated factor
VLSENFQATHQTLLSGYLTSTSAHQLSLCGILVEEWTRVRDETYRDDVTRRLQDAVPSAEPLIELLDKLVDVGPPSDLYEAQASIQAIRQEAKTLVTLVERHNKDSYDPLVVEERWAAASIHDVEVLLATDLEVALSKLTPAKRKIATASTKDRVTTLSTAVERYRCQQAQLETQVQATAAAALIGMRFVPTRMNPLMKGIMNGVKVCPSALYDDPNQA